MIAFHSGGGLAYVVNQGANTVSGFAVDSTSGALSSLGAATNVTGATSASAVAVSSGTNSYLLVADSGSTQLALFPITVSTGALGALQAATFTGCGSAFSIVVNSGTAPFVYAACGNTSVASIPIAGWPGGSIQTATAGTTTSNIALNSSATHAFVSNAGSGNVSAFSVSFGAFTAAGTVTTCTTPAQIHINSSNFAYVVCNGENKVNAYSVSGSSLNLVGSYTTGSQPTSVAGY
jgi:6-phosphogluconolactonase (cycloisomerase 2 family)